MVEKEKIVSAQPAIGTDPGQKHAGAGPGLRPGVKAPGVFVGDCYILNLFKHSRPGGPRSRILIAPPLRIHPGS